MDKIIRLGNTSTYKTSECNMVYDVGGVFPTICACTHGYAIGYILEVRSGKQNNSIGNVGYSRGT